VSDKLLVLIAKPGENLADCLSHWSLLRYWCNTGRSSSAITWHPWRVPEKLFL